MAVSSSDSEISYDSDDSEYNYIPGVIDLPNFDEEDENEQENPVESASETIAGPYCDEPLADQEWLAEYRKQKELEEEVQKQLQRRLNKDDACGNWCQCGNCKVELLQNVYEAKCCQEISRCVESCARADVLEETREPPVCITLHPGFRPVCLERWSLKQSASKYKTKDQRRYQQSGKESTFLRAIAYREFSQLVYGFLGAERIPLPACAYHKIRSTFTESEDGYTGFEEE